MGGVELDEPAPGQAAGQQGLPAGEGEDPLDLILIQQPPVPRRQIVRQGQAADAFAVRAVDPRWSLRAEAAGFAPSAVVDLERVERPEGRLLLQTLRSHDQYNTTIYSLNDRYRGIKKGRHVVFVNPLDLDDLGLPQVA